MVKIKDTQFCVKVSWKGRKLKFLDFTYIIKPWDESGPKSSDHHELYIKALVGRQTEKRRQKSWKEADSASSPCSAALKFVDCTLANVLPN